MASFVINLVTIRSERPPAIRANVRLLASVSSNVMAKTRSLREFALAVGEGAGIWLDP